jgi:TusA-related sulfurtransferase
MKTIDTSGLGCPQPILMAKKALNENKEGIDVIVDNNTAKNNVERFCKNLGYSVECKSQGESFLLEVRR